MSQGGMVTDKVEAFSDFDWNSHGKVYGYTRNCGPELVEFMEEVTKDPCCASTLFYQKYVTRSGKETWREFQLIDFDVMWLMDPEECFYYFPDGILRHWRQISDQCREIVMGWFAKSKEEYGDEIDNYDPVDDDDVDLNCHSDEDDDVIYLGTNWDKNKKRRVE